MILFFVLAVIGTLSAFPSFLFPFGFWPAAWVCLIPFFFCLARSGALYRRLLTGGLFGVCFYALLIRWFISYSLPGYLFFVIVLSVQPLLFAFFFPPPFSSRIFRLFYWPALWTGSEYVRQALLRGFSWNLGCSQSFNLYVLQWASLGGSFLLSFFLVLCNTCFYEMAEAKERRLFYIKMLAAVNLLAWAGGAAQYYFLSGAPVREPPVRAAVVQAAADPREKLDADRVSRFVGAHVRLSFARDPFSSVDMIVWPETAVPLDPRQDIFLMGTVVEMCRRQGAGVLTGMAWEDDEGRLYNGAAWIGPTGEFFEVYRKQYLVPFSEEQPWPGRRLGAFIEENWGKNAYHFTRGEGLGVLPLSFIRPGLSGSVGLAICSEDTVSALFRKYAHAGVDLMIVLLNDGWFQDSTALIQHAQNSILRAVEIRRPVLRAANSGWTCLIDPRGRVLPLSETGLMEAGAGVFELVPFSGRAPYVFIGDSFCILLTAFVIISLLLSRVKKIENRVMRKFLSLLAISVCCFSFPLFSEAGGVAARKQQGVRVHPQVQVQPSSPGRPGVWPASSSGNQSQEREEAQATPAPSLIPKQSYPESRVLTSAAGRAGGQIIGSVAADADMTVEESLIQLLALLEQSSEIWTQISDVNYKVLVVSQHIERYRQEGTLIRKPPVYYAQFITSMGEGNPALLSRPFSELLRLAAIMDYDFETGQNKDALARSVLGDEMYRANRKRLGMP